MGESKYAQRSSPKLSTCVTTLLFGLRSFKMIDDHESFRYTNAQISYTLTEEGTTHGSVVGPSITKELGICGCHGSFE